MKIKHKKRRIWIGIVIFCAILVLFVRLILLNSTNSTLINEILGMDLAIDNPTEKSGVADAIDDALWDILPDDAVKSFDLYLEENADQGKLGFLLGWIDWDSIR